MHPLQQLSRTDSRYPELLSHISDPPQILFYRGNLSLLSTPCIGVVGTRKLTPYGKQAATTITRDLVRHGFTIVSGLALGIDAVAHLTALEYNGPTIAVLGTGIDDDSIYPRHNFRLAMEILQSGGLILTENPDGTPGMKHVFPARNRIISGLSKGVVVIEADEKSGALITTKFAAEQNRDVFAVPGPISSPRSIGPNKLIQMGAKLILSGDDVAQEYSDSLPLFKAASQKDSLKDPVERKIVDILKETGPQFINIIIQQSGMESAKVIAALSMLELQGRIKNTNNGMYQIV